MKVLICGLGSIGRRHLQNLVALRDREGEDLEIELYRTRRSTLPDDELAAFPVETDLEAALARRPEAVIVSNPTALHLDVAIPAARAGCALLLEKPVSHSLERVDSLQESVKNSGSRVLVGFHFRFHPGLQRVAGLLKDGSIGRPLSARAHWGEYLPGWHPWEDYRLGYSAQPGLGGGVILTLSHPLDYLRWLLGEVEALWALAGKLSDLEIEVEDTAEIGIQFRSGVLAGIHLDYNERPPAHFLEVIGTGGKLRWDNADGCVRRFSVPPSGSAEWELFPPVPEGRVFERNDLFLAEMRHFLAVARGQAEPVTTLYDGVQALRLALAALESAEEGRLVRI